MKNSIRSVAVAALLACGATGAMAALAVSSSVPAGPILFSDNSAERWIDNNNNQRLDAGDALRGIFKIDNVTGSDGIQTALGAGSVYNELTGLFQVVVLTGGSDPLSLTSNYTFGTDSTFEATWGTGVVGVLFDDPAQDFARSSCGVANDFAACEATATGGSVWAKVGIGATGFWSAAGAATNPAIGAGLPLTTPLGAFGMGLDFITNNSGYLWNQVDCFDSTTFSTSKVDICGQGGIVASGRLNGTNPTNTPYDIFDNVDFTMNRIPEPGSMALMGLALLGLGVSRRNRKV